MKMDSKLRRTIGSKFKVFCKHSTLHGLYYFYKTKSWSVCLIWGCIVVSSFILCGFLCQMIWNKYTIDPTFTVVESTRYSMAKIGFPAITLCDTEPIYGPNTGNVTSILQRRGFSKDQIEEFYISINANKNKHHLSQPYVDKMHTLLEDIGISFNDLMNILKKPCDHLLISCVWRSKTHNCQHMFREVLTVFGFCCQFDMKLFRSNVKTANVTFISGTEISEALQVTVNGQVIFPNGSQSSGFIRLYVFDENEKVTLLDNPVILTASTFYDVGIDVWVIDSSEHVETLPLDSRKCLMSTDKGEGADFYRGCISMYILDEVVEHCRCLPFNYTAFELQVADHMQCSWELLPCVYSTIDMQMAELSSITSESRCYESCEYVQYEMEMDYFEETTSENKLYSRFAVHFVDETCLKYRKHVLYLWDQMLANLGGIFGLCVGGSIISIVEFIWFLIDILLTITTSFCEKKNANKRQNTQKVFATSFLPTRNHKLAFVH